MQIYKNKNIQLYKNTNVQIYDKYWKNGWGYWTGEEKVTWNALERRWLDFTWSHYQSAGPEAGCGTFFIEKSKKNHRQIQKNYREIQNFHSKSPPVSWTWGTFLNSNISDIFLIYSHIFWYISERGCATFFIDLFLIGINAIDISILLWYKLMQLF